MFTKAEAVEYLREKMPEGTTGLETLDATPTVRGVLDVLELCGVLAPYVLPVAGAPAAPSLPQKHDMETLLAGLEEIRKVFNYATDHHQTRYNIMRWVQDSVGALLDGKSVEEPPRHGP